jgi:chromosome segregation ATPase
MIRNGGYPMANDVIFKTKAFGGFNKEEVMTYINRLISEKEELENKCKALTEEKNNLKNEVSEISQKLKTAEDKAEREIKEREDVLKILDAEREIRDAVCKEKDEFGVEILKLNKELTELKNKPVLSEEDAEVLKAENAKLKAECDKLKAMEQQVGAAMLDARLRSDELVKEAEEKANLVRKDVYDAIGDTALKIDELSGGITEIARNFTKAVSEVEMRINLLTGNMSKTAQALISNNLETPLRIQNTVVTETEVTYSDLVSDIEQSIAESVTEAEQEIESVKDSFSDDEQKAKIKIKAKPVE